MSATRIRPVPALLVALALLAVLVVASGCSMVSSDGETGEQTGTRDELEDDPTGAPLDDAGADEATAQHGADQQSDDPSTGSTDSDARAEDDDAAVSAWPLALAPVGAPVPDPSVLPVAADVRTGRLDNGLVYFAQSNDSPGSAVSLRLAVNAGSLQQEIPDSGLAHFVEHMMFNGTQTWPGNSLLDALQQIGAEIGPDFNAFTSQNETVYLLDLPTNAPEDVAIGMQILAEWASSATMDDNEIVAERGVVREEIRLRDEGPTADIDTRFDLAYFAGTPYENADPGGISERVLETTRADAVRYYDRWYRPDNMAVVAVGDLDVDDLVGFITDAFTDITDRSDGAPRTDFQVDLIDEPLVEVLVEPAAGTSFISIDWTVPVWDQGTAGGERLSRMQDLIAAMMQTRLRERVARGEADLFDPFVGHLTLNRDRALLGLNTSSLDLAAGTTTVLEEFVIAASEGFSEDELRRAKEDSLSGLDEFEGGLATLQDSFLADRLWWHFLTGSDASGPEELLQRLRAMIDGLDVDQVNTHFSWIMQNAAPIVILVGETEDDVPTRGELIRAIDSAVDVLGTGRGDRESFETIEVDRLVDPGPSVEVIDRSEVDGIDRASTQLLFANGARVLFAESAIDAGGVSLQARAEGGWSALEPEDAELVHVAVNAASRSGLGSLDALSLDRYMRSSQAWLSPFITETVEGFSGGSTADDLEDLFALVHLRSTAASVEGPGLAQAKEDSRDLLRSVRTDPATALSVEATRLRYGDDSRQTGVVSEDQLDGLDAIRALDIYDARFVGVDDLTIAIAGDVELETVIELSERYIATIPAKPADTWLDTSPPIPEGITQSEIEIGPPGSAGAVSMLFSVPTEWDTRRSVMLDLLDQILNQRLFETVREELSATYGGWVAFRRADEPDGTVESQVLIQGDPERLDEIRDAVVGEIAEVATEGPSVDEFDRAVTVLSSDYGFITNGDLIDQLLAAADADEEPLNSSNSAALLRSLERSEIRELAAELLPLDRRIEVFRSPESE